MKNVKAMMMAFAAFAAVTAVADTLYLNSGSVLTGKILGIADGKVKIATDEIGEIAVPTNVVKSHVMSAAASAEKAEKAVAKVSAPVPGVVDIAPIPVPPETWHGSFHINYQGARGNSYQNAGGVDLALSRRWTHDRFTGSLLYDYAESGKATEDPTKTTDRWTVDLKHDHFWLNKVYHYETLRYDRDMIRLLRGRYRAGLGGGYQWLENRNFDASGKWNFNQELGVNWVKDDFENGEDVREFGYCALRYGHHLEWVPKWVPTMRVFHNAEILPEADKWDKLMSRVDLGLAAKIFLNLDLQAKIEWDYDSKPVNNRKASDYRFVIGVGYAW